MHVPMMSRGIRTRAKVTTKDDPDVHATVGPVVVDMGYMVMPLGLVPMRVDDARLVRLVLPPLALSRVGVR